MSETEIFIDRTKYRHIRDAATAAGISSSYLSKFCREGEVKATRVDGVWFVNETSLRELLEARDVKKREWHERLTAERIAERAAPVPVRAFSRDFVPLPRSRVAPRTLHRVTADRRAREASTRRTLVVASVASLLFISSLGFAFSGVAPVIASRDASVASIADVGASIARRFTSFFDSIFAVNDYSIPPAWEKTIIEEPEQARSGSTINNTTNNNYVTNNNYIQTGSASGGVSERVVDGKLAAMENYFDGRLDLLAYEGQRQTEDLADDLSNGIGGAGFDDIDITDSSFTGGSISGSSLSDITFLGDTAFSSLSVTDATSTNATSTNVYVSGSFGFGTSSGLLQTTNGTASTLANGGNGQVLKMVGGNLAWSTDLTGGGGGGASFFASTTDDLAIYPADPTDVVIIGDSATTSVGHILEVAGNALLRGGVTTYGPLTAPRFVATSSTASVLPYASTTAISTNSLCINGDCRQAWPTDSAFSTTSADYWKSITSFFSTSSADYYTSVNNFFSTSSANYWKTANDFFSTTSASYFLAQNQGTAFSTTSADHLLSTYIKGFFFSTSSASYFLSQNGALGFSTTSNDYWLTQRNFFSTTSADAWKDQRNFFSTSSASYFASTGLAFSTTSNEYWKSVSNFFSTTSADAWKDQRNFFSTTSASYFLAQNGALGFSTTSANYFVSSSTTLPKTYSANTFTALQTFGNASSSIFSANTICLSTDCRTSWPTAGSSFDYPFSLSGNATSTLTQFNGGLTAFASSTIGNGTASGGLTVNGTATTSRLVVTSTGTSTFAGDILMGGSIIPSLDNTYSLGSESRMWKDVYIGPGSLYVNGKKVIEDVSNTITISTDNDQNLMSETSGVGNNTMRATGSGNMNLLSSSGNINVTSTSGNINIGTSGSGQLNLGIIASGTWQGMVIADNYLVKSGNWTGTFDGYEAAQLLAGSFSTTSADFWKTQGVFFSTTSADYWGSTKGYSTFGYLFPSSATSTLLNFNGGLTAYASSTIGNGSATGGLTVSGTATTSALVIDGNTITIKNGSNNSMINSSGSAPFFINGGSSGNGMHFQLGQQTYLGLAGSNTATISQRSGVGLLINAISGQTGNFHEWRNSAGTGLGAITTIGNLGLGTTTPYAQLSLLATSTSGRGSPTTLFAIASTTGGVSTTTLFSISNTGSTTASNGFNITAGCYAMNGTCLSSGSASLTGTTGQLAYFSGTNTAVGTSSLFLASSGFVGIGTSTPGALLNIHQSSGLSGFHLSRTGFSTGAFTLSSSANGNTLLGIGTPGSTATLFQTALDLTSGNLGIGTTTPTAKLTVYGDTLFNGTDRYTNFGTTTGASGYGFRDNAGVMEFKNANGTWQGVTTATTGPSFSVHKNGNNQTVVTNTPTLATWTTEIFDTNNNFNLATGRFQPTVPGKYIITGSAYTSNGTAAAAILYKNGSAIYDSGATAVVSDLTTIVDMNGTSDYLELFMFVTSGTTVGGEPHFTYFSGIMIAPVNGNNAAGWANDGSASFLLDNDDKVGIGTTTPWGKLSINSTAGMPQFVIGSSTATQFIVDKDGNVGIGTAASGRPLALRNALPLMSFDRNGSYTWELGVDNSTYSGFSDFIFRDVSTNSVRMMIEATSGNVGIGTTTPTAALTAQTSGSVGSVSLGTWTTSASYGFMSVNGLGGTSANFYSAPGDTNLYINRPTGSAINFREGNVQQMTIAASGNVGIGTTTPISTLSIQGSLCVRSTGSCGTTAGTIYATTAAISDIDLAENYRAVDTTLIPGEIVSLEVHASSTIRRAVQGEEALGVLSTKPGLLLGQEIKDGRAVALKGRVPLKVNMEGGPIAIGDRLTISSVPGVGTKATTSSYTVARALEATSVSGEIEVFVENEYTLAIEERTALADLLNATSTMSSSPVFANIFARMTSWLADAGNGIAEIFAKTIRAENVYADTVTANEICVKKSDGTHVCVTGDELEAVLGSSGSTPSAPAPEPEPEPEETEPSPTPDTPEEEPAPAPEVETELEPESPAEPEIETPSPETPATPEA